MSIYSILDLEWENSGDEKRQQEACVDEKNLLTKFRQINESYENEK